MKIIVLCWIILGSFSQAHDKKSSLDILDILDILIYLSCICLLEVDWLSLLKMFSPVLIMQKPIPVRPGEFIFLPSDFIRYLRRGEGVTLTYIGFKKKINFGVSFFVKSNIAINIGVDFFMTLYFDLLE